VREGKGQSKTSGRKAAKQFEIAERRRMVALLVRAGVTQQEVAARLGMSEGTVSGDVAALKEAWARAAQEDVAQMVVEERAALDADEVKWRELMGQAETPTSKARCYDTVLAIMHRRAQLVGLDSVLKRKQAELEAGSRGLDAL
jgi:transcriptional regulator with XRE-family HTH domain